MKPSPLPPEWQCLETKVQYVQRVSAKEYSCSCPVCGGQVHESGEPPDRCRLFVDDHPTLWCRRCGTTAYPDQFGDERFTPPTPEQLEGFRQKREESEAARLRSAQTALAHLRDTKLWEQFHKMLDDRARAYWRGRGIPDAYQNYWVLGWDHQRDAATIPIFGPAWEPLNVKLRLMDESKGRYRYLLSGQPAPLFLADPDMALENHVIAIEGELKAATTYVTLDDPSACIVGLPGLNPPPSITDALARAERVTLVLDPGSGKVAENGWSPAGKLVQAIGRKRCRVLITPMKIDDGIIAAGLCRGEVRAMIDAAVTM